MEEAEQDEEGKGEGEEDDQEDDQEDDDDEDKEEEGKEEWKRQVYTVLSPPLSLRRVKGAGLLRRILPTTNREAAWASIAPTASGWLLSIWCTVSPTNDTRAFEIAQISSMIGRQQSGRKHHK